MTNNHVINPVPISKFDSVVQMTILIHVKLKILLAEQMNTLFTFQQMTLVVAPVTKVTS